MNLHALVGMIAILVQAKVMILWELLDTLTKCLSTVRLWIRSIEGICFLRWMFSKIARLFTPLGVLLSTSNK